MALDLWFPQDVARILAATWETMRATAEGTRRAAQASSEDRLVLAYERGFEDALRALGVAFGLANSGTRIPRMGATLVEGPGHESMRHPPAGTTTEYD
jgi:hypothetical protein